MSRTGARGIFGLVFWILVAKFYTEAEVGWGSAIIAVMSLIALLSRLGFNASLIRFLPKAVEPRDMVNSCLTFSGIVALILSVIFVAGVDIWSPALHFVRENAIFYFTFVLFVLFDALSEMVDSVFIAKRRAEFVLIRVVMMLMIRLTLVVVMAMFFRTFGIAASWGFAVAIAFAFALFLFLPKVESAYRPIPKLKVSVIGNVWRYAAGSYLASLFQIAPTFILPIMVVNLQRPEQNAYFYIAWILASVLFAIPMAVGLSMFAEGSHYEERLREYVRKSIKFAFLLVIPAAVLVILFGKWILLFFGEGYLNGLLLLRILCISSLFVALNRIYTSTLRVEYRMKELVLIYGLQAAAVLLGSYSIIDTIGITGIGYIWLAAQGIVSLYAFTMMMSRYRAQ